MPRRHLSVTEVAQLVTLVKDGYRYQQVGDRLDVSASVVCRAYNRYLETDGYGRQAGKGRRRVTYSPDDRAIIRHFRQEPFVPANKIKKYQQQSGNTPRRLIQDVATRWNSKFYMLQRCVELQELNSAMINVSMEVLTSYEWHICKELCTVFGPCEEVTRGLSSEKCDWEPSHSHNYEPDTKPIFKLYYENQATTEETKCRIIALVVQEQNKALDQNTATVEKNDYSTPIQGINSIKCRFYDSI
ncbi:unnamed protein product [Euphydryas editha]|uniref:Uncharacterized protein n=1 Tax=Euphydryas editha TaxID=104508 RepID=A0AAU9VD82_EUPED|nr:unnamed protein product [Euphydryas editha]